MAFTYCTNCGEKIDDSEVKCPHCGHIRGQDRSYTYGQADNGRPQNNSYGQNNYGPNGNNQNGYNPNGYNQNGYNQNGYNQNGYNQNGYNQNGYNQNGYNQNGYNQNGYNQNGYNQNGYDPNGYNPNGYDPNGYNPNGQYQPPQPPQKRPLNVGVMVISILNIVFGCCGIPMIFGIIGLVLAFQAQSVLSDKEAQDKNKLALTINIIGLVLMVVSVASMIALMAFDVIDSLALVGSLFF